MALYLKGGYVNIWFYYTCKITVNVAMGGCSCGLGKASKNTSILCKKIFLKNPISIGIDLPCISAKGIFSTVYELVFTTNVA